MIMTCGVCRRSREVSWHPLLTQSEQYLDYVYICCRCVGVSQKNARLMRRDDPSLEEIIRRLRKDCTWMAT
jgi:hypothetical protein